MKFIEMTGDSLAKIIVDDELSMDELKESGVVPETIVRINQQGDIEVRRKDQWDVIGGLLGDFEARTKNVTELDWA
ncbi:MAG: hypothetical protein MPJ24_08845 [Pirellulaceae bacterium]|nr:hypothetical protein [Pirellulaceae bacterium]